MKTDKRITSFDDHLDEQYGKEGTESRKEFQEEFETFKIGVLIQEARKKQHLTQPCLPVSAWRLLWDRSHFLTVSGWKFHADL